MLRSTCLFLLLILTACDDWIVACSPDRLAERPEEFFAITGLTVDRSIAADLDHSGPLADGAGLEKNLLGILLAHLANYKTFDAIGMMEGAVTSGVTRPMISLARPAEGAGCAAIRVMQATPTPTVVPQPEPGLWSRLPGAQPALLTGTIAADQVKASAWQDGPSVPVELRFPMRRFVFSLRLHGARIQAQLAPDGTMTGWILGVVPFRDLLERWAVLISGEINTLIRHRVADKDKSNANAELINEFEGNGCPASLGKPTNLSCTANPNLNECQILPAEVQCFLRRYVGGFLNVRAFEGDRYHPDPSAHQDDRDGIAMGFAFTARKVESPRPCELGPLCVDQGLSTKADLQGVWGLPLGGLVAVGSTGTVLHHDGLRWTQVQDGQPGQHVYSVWSNHEDEFWVSGKDLLWRFHFVYGGQGKWGRDEVPLPTKIPIDYRGLWGGEQSLWLIRANHSDAPEWEAGIDVYDRHNRSWSHDPIATSFKTELSAIHGAEESPWVAGSNGTVYRSNMPEWDKFSQADNSASDVWVLGREHAAVSFGQGSRTQIGALKEFHSGRWKIYIDSAPAALTTVFSATPGDIWAAGDVPAGEQEALIYHVRNGQVDRLRGPAKSLQAAYGTSPEDLWFVGAGGTVLRLEPWPR